MKRIETLILTLVLFCMFSCSEKNQESTSAKKVKIVFDDEEFLNFSDYFIQLKFISLETNESNLFRNITNAEIKYDKIFIFSMAPDNMVSIYDMEGKFLNKINNIGKGPRQINFATSFDVDTCISILDRGNMKMINYNFEGVFLSENRFNNLNFNSFSFLKGNRIIFYEIHSAKFYEVHSPKSMKAKNNNVPETKLTIWEFNKRANMNLINNVKDLNDGKQINIMLKNYFTTHKDVLYHWEVYNDSIMGVNLDTFDNKLCYLLDFGKYRIPDVFLNEFNQKIPFQRLTKISKKGYAILEDFIYCGNDHQIFTIRRSSDFSIGIKKEDSSELKCYMNLCLDNINRNLKIKLSPKSLSLVNCDNQSFVYFEWKTIDFIKKIDELKRQLSTIEWESILDSNPSLKKILSKIKIDDNPIIMVAKLK